MLDPSNPENSEDNPYVIDSSAKLAELAYQVNNGNNYSGKYFILNADLNLNDLSWTTIGYHEETAFSGYFDGNNHSVSGLKIYHDGYAGLFAAVFNGVIKNLTLIEPVVTYDDYQWVGNIGVAAGVAEHAVFENINVINPTITGGWWIGEFVVGLMMFLLSIVQ